MLTETNMKHIWLKMSQIYGHKWTSNYGDKDGDNTWLSGLQDIPETMILAGLSKCLSRQDPWPPSLPEFRQMCLNMPSLEQVVQEVITGKSKSSLGFMIAKKIPSFDRQTKTEAQLRRMIISLYDDCYQDAAIEIIHISAALEKAGTKVKALI